MEGKRTIHSIKLKNILSFGSEGQEVELQPLNVLIGPNASGKSNFIEAFRLLQALPTNPTKVIRDGGGVAEWLWKGDEAVPTARIAVNVGPIHYWLDFTKEGYYWQIVDEYIGDPIDPSNPPIDPPITRKSYSPEDENGFPDPYPPETSLLEILKNQQPEGTLAKLFSSIGIYKDWDNSRNSKLRSGQRPDLPSRPLLEDLSNFGLLFNNLPNRIKLGITKQLKQVYEGLEEIRTPIDGGVVQIWIQEEGLSSPTPAARVSDGTLRYLFLLTLLKQPDPPPLICLEEPETGLHPDLIHSVAELLIEASQRTQLIITTHSESLVSSLTDFPEAVIVCERDQTGTQLKRLDPERLKTWLERYSLGELWMTGELGGTRW